MTPSNNLVSCDTEKRSSVFLMVVFWTSLTSLKMEPVPPPTPHPRSSLALDAFHWFQPISMVTQPQPHKPVFPKPVYSTSRKRNNHPQRYTVLARGLLIPAVSSRPLPHPLLLSQGGTASPLTRISWFSAGPSRHVKFFSCSHLWRWKMWLEYRAARPSSAQNTPAPSTK